MVSSIMITQKMIGEDEIIGSCEVLLETLEDQFRHDMWL
jgi:hypothetical protein